MFVLFCFFWQVRVRFRLLSAASRSAPPTLFLWRPIWTRRWMALIRSSARHCEPIPPVRSAPQRAAGGTWSFTPPCWASLTSWVRGTAPKTGPHPPPIPSSPSSPATITAGTTTMCHGSGQAPGHLNTLVWCTCSVACSGTLILGLSKTSFRRVRLRARGLSLITTICQCRSLMFQWFMDPVPQLPIRWVFFL